jgi:hypothetical protein
MMRRFPIVVIAILLAGNSSPVRAQSGDAFRVLSVWGRWLYDYDTASRIAADTIAASHPDLSGSGISVALQVGSQWVVAFGRLTPDRFQIADEVTLDSLFGVRSSSHHSPVLIAPDLWLRAARALATGVTRFGRHKHKFTPIVLPQADSTWSVYVVPAETGGDTAYIGGDVRYKVSADGLTVLQTTALHASLVALHTPPADAELPALVHTHTLILVPVETDVFYVLRHRPRLRHYISSDNRVFAIEPDGGIRFVMER